MKLNNETCRFLSFFSLVILNMFKRLQFTLFLIVSSGILDLLKELREQREEKLYILMKIFLFRLVASSEKEEDE